MFKQYENEDYKMVLDGQEYISSPDYDGTMPIMISAFVVFGSLFVTALSLIF